MSENNNQNLEDKLAGPVLNHVAITPEDVQGAAEFWNLFKIPMPPELNEAFAAFVAKPTLETQREVKYQLTKALSETDHEILREDMFKEIVEACRVTAYDMGFSKELEARLSSEE